jgi:2-polyprenyl-3-methyl-5-hydroxy-6-metoxy-1,4-benzoquinol methylase
MESFNGGSFNADALAPGEVAVLKALEQRNRDLGAATYSEWLRSNRSPFHLWAEARTVLHYLKPQSKETVLDVGCGVGRLSMLVAPKVARLVCVDLSAMSLQVLQAEAKARGIQNIETVQSDLCALRKPVPSCDAVYCVDMLQHIPSHLERLIAVRRCYEALNRGGRFLISVYCWNVRNRKEGIEKEGFWGTGERRLYRYYFSPADLRTLLEEAGFRDIRIRGQIILPARITQHFPRSLALMETWCSMAPCFRGLGRYVMATGRK